MNFSNFGHANLAAALQNLSMSSPGFDFSSARPAPSQPDSSANANESSSILSMEEMVESRGTISAGSLIAKARIRQLTDPHLAAIEAEVFGEDGADSGNGKSLLEAAMANIVSNDVRSS